MSNAALNKGKNKTTNNDCQKQSSSNVQKTRGNISAVNYYSMNITNFTMSTQSQIKIN